MNRCYDEFGLANLIFYMDGTAKVCFQNHEETMESWAYFKEELLLLFGNYNGGKYYTNAVAPKFSSCPLCAKEATGGNA